MECTRGHRESMNAYVRRESMERLTGGGGKCSGVVAGAREDDEGTTQENDPDPWYVPHMEGDAEQQEEGDLE